MPENGAIEAVYRGLSHSAQVIKMNVQNARALYARPMSQALHQHEDTSRTALRSATSEAHARLDALMQGGLQDAATYRAYLQAMHRFLGDAEVVLDELPRRSLWVARDLATLGVPALPPRGVLRRAGLPEERLGWEYVIVGSSLGARLLQRDARKLGFDADNGARFLAAHTDGDAWANLLKRLSAIEPTQNRRITLLVRGARDAFASAEASFRRALQLDAIP